MPRRKRTTAQNEGQRKCRRADNKDEETLVISDSENEEEEEAVSKVSTRESRWQDRETRTQMQHMTEEEMLDLAMRLSKQEANSAAQRQQLEDDDIQKAIAESLHVSHSQAWEENSETASSVAKQSQDPSTVTARMRRKLYFPSKREADRARDDVTAAAESGEDSMQDSKSLLPMPDLSQKTLSQSPPPSPSLPSVPSTSSQEHQSPQWKSPNEQVLKVPNEQDSPEDEPSQGDSEDETQCSDAFLQQCFVRVDKVLMSTGRTSDNSQTTHNISLSSTCPDRSQLTQKQSPSPVKSPVFAKTDPKDSAALSADNGTLCLSQKKYTDKVCTLKKEEEEDETCKDSSSHKNQVNESREHQKRLSLCRKAQPSARSLVPDVEEEDGAKQETVQPDQLKDGSSSSFSAELEKVPNSEDMPLHADNKSLEEFTSHMVLHLSDDDDDDDDEEEEEKVVVPSPVFHQECVPHSDHPKLSPTQHCFSPPTATTSPLCSRTQNSDLQNICTRKKCTSKTAYPAESNQRERGVQKKPACDSRSTHVIDEKSDGFVSYYWGVPFCPRGQNPDDYTRVILSQLEVYEKSLKEAQHQLLHKAEWGLPLFPSRAERPFSRRMKRHRAPQLLEEEEEDPEKEEEEDQKKADDEEEEDDGGEERAESQAASGEAAENEQNETYVVVSSPDSPETQKEIVEKSPLPFRQHEDSDAVRLSSCRKSSPHDPSEDTQIDQSDDNKKAQDENYDVESTMCPETQMSEDNTPELMVTSPVQPQLQEETDVMEVDEEAAEDERMEQEQAEEEQQQQREPVPPQSQRVECPMCSRFFPISKIEVHAAYCDGTTEEPEQEEESSQVPALRSRNRRIEMGGTSPRSTENRSEQRHKCYLCQRFFTSEEMYIHHVDKCLKQKQSKSNQGNGLLSALHKAEHVDDDDSGAGPSDTTIKSQGGPAESSEVAESGGDEDGSASGFYVSSSPIKSFTPISEATDCLIDFQNQYSDRTSRRLGRKRKLKLFKMA